MNDSDDDSSDSSNDFAGITPKDGLTASFFSIKPVTKPNLVNSKDDSEGESSDDENFASVPENNGIELFSEVVKNLEASQRAYVNDEEPKQHSSKDDNMQIIKEVKTGKKGKNISDEINAVLLQGESGAHAFREDDEDPSDEEEQEEELARPEDYTIPKEGVKITLPGTSMVFKKKTGSKKESDLAALLRRKLKANQIIIEKAARLCWLAYGFHLNHQANDPEIMTTVVSLVSTKNYPKDSFNLEYLTKFTKWFKNIFTIESSDNEVIIDKETLLKRITEKKIYNYRELVILYVAILRGIGLHCRIVVSLNPPLVKTYNELLPKTNTTEKDGKIKEETKETKTKTKSSKRNKKNVDSKKDLKNNSVQNNESARINANIEAKKRAAEILRSKYSYNKKNKDKLNSNISVQDKASTSKNIETASTSSKKVESGPRRLRSHKAQDVVSTSTKQQNNTKIISENNQPKMRNSKRQSRSDDSSSEEEEPPSKSKRKYNNKDKIAIKSKGMNENKNQASTDDEETDNKLKRRDVWAEVYVESKASWICINVLDENVDCVTEIYVSNLRID